MTKNEELYDRALEGINKLFSDQSVSKEKAMENLYALKGEVDTMIEAPEE